MTKNHKMRSLPQRIARVIVKSFLFIILFILVIFILILLPPVQNLIKHKAVHFLENKLHTKIEIGSIYLGLPRTIIIEDLYVQDRKQDTLAYAGSLRINVGLWKLIFKSEMDINKIELNNSTLKIKREWPDTTFNFQFIVDAFSPSKDESKKDTTKTSSPISIHSVVLDKIRLVMSDTVTGNNAVVMLNHFDTRIDKIDPGQSVYDVPVININGLTTSIYQYKPLLEPDPIAKDIVEAKQPIALQLLLDKIGLENIHLDYRNDVSALYSNINLNEAAIDVKTLDLSKRIISLSDLSLQQLMATVKLGKKEQAKIVAKETKQEIKSQADAGWRIEAASVKLDNNAIRFDNENSPVQPNGMDYAHLHADSLTLHLNNLLFSPDSISGEITKGNVKEKSGFELQELEGSFLYGSTGGYIRNLHLKTPATDLKRDIVFQYPSLAAIKSNPGIIEITADIPSSRLGVTDILTFVPDLRKQPAFANTGATWYITGKINGRLNNLNINKLSFRGFSGTALDLNGKIVGLPDMKKVKADLALNNLTTNKADMALFLPAGSIPSNISLPTYLHANGKINGDIAGMKADLALQTNYGDANVNGLFKEYTNPQQISYDATIGVKSLNVGMIMHQEQKIGVVSASFKIKGIGTDPKTAHAELDGTIQSAVLNGYDYRDLTLKGRIANQQATIDAAIMDPNIHFALNGSADLTKEYPSVIVHLTIDSIKAQPLNLASNLVVYRGNLDADIPVTNPDKLEGKILLTQTLLVNGDKRIQLDTMQLLAGVADSGNYIRLISDAGSAELTGNYRLTELGYIFQQAIQPYFAVMPTQVAATKLQPYDFNLNATIVNSPILNVVMPGLTKTDPITLRSHFGDASGWNATVTAPFIDMSGSIVKNLALQAGTEQNKINLKANVDQLSSGGMALINAAVTATIADNKIDFLFNSKGSTGKDRYNLSAILQQPSPGNYSLSIKPADLILNYEPWSIGPNNALLVRGSDINARDFVLQKNGQVFTLASASTNINSPLEAAFSNFKLATITAFFQQDASLTDGTMNGKLLLTNLSSNPVFTGDLTIDNLAIQKDTVGNVKILMNNKSPNTYYADVRISGRGNDVQLTGNYYPEAVSNNNFDFAIDIVALPLTTAQAFSQGAITDASGFIKGKFTFKGTAKDPSIMGDLNFDKAAFNLRMLNSYFTIDQERIKVTDEGFTFNDFAVKDSAGNTLSVNGTAATHNFQNYQFDLTVRANDFRALNSTKMHNRYFYGQLYFNTNMRITGTEAAPVVDGRLTVNEKTKVTIVLPQAEPGIVDREGVVEFVDLSAGVNDSLFLSALDSLNTVGFTGMDISMNLQLDKEAEITLVIDEGNGDFLNLKGEASITADVDRAGKIFMSGSYELEQGAYEISFNLLRRRFAIQKGSRITWQGEPTKADVDITAIYTVNTSPLDLVKNQLSEGITASQRNTYLQKLPFEVTLRMTGELMKPLITFDIRLPENKSFQVSNDIITLVKTRLDQLRQEEGEMNKQVFSLLLLSRFVAENPFASSGGGTNVSTLARQSVSRLLTEQLNRLASDLVTGFELNFDVQSSEDYTTGSRKDRTDLNVGISKRLMNDRLTVTVGSNFELEGPQSPNSQTNNIAGNVALDYKISKDGRYLLRAYRKNDYQGIIDGYVIETGVGFIITVDYNRFKDIFRSRRARQRDREARQKNETSSVIEKIPTKE